MQKLLDNGMPTDFFPGSSTPVLYNMIRTQSPAVIEKVLKAMPEKSKAKVKNWRSAQQKKGIIDYTQNEQIKNLLRRYLAPGVTR